MNSFHRKLIEAVATLDDVGTAPPPIDVNDGDGGEGGGDFNRQAVYDWVNANFKVISRPIAAQLGSTAPVINVAQLRVDQGSGLVLHGSASLVARWDCDPDAIVEAVGPTLLRSDIWKHIGSTYESGHGLLSNPEFADVFIRACQYKLNLDGNAAFWLYENQGQFAQHAQQIITQNLESRAQGKFKLGAIKLKLTGKPAPALPKDHQASHRLTGGLDLAQGPPPLTVAARMAFVFSAPTTSPEDAALGADVYTARAVVGKLRDVLDDAWEQLADELEVNVDHHGELLGWEPERHRITIDLAQAVSELQADSEADAATLARLLADPPKHLLKTAAQDFSYEDRAGQEREVTLRVLGTKAAGGTLTVVVDVDVR